MEPHPIRKKLVKWGYRIAFFVGLASGAPTIVGEVSKGLGWLDRYVPLEIVAVLGSAAVVASLVLLILMAPTWRGSSLPRGLAGLTVLGALIATFIFALPSISIDSPTGSKVAQAGGSAIGRGHALVAVGGHGDKKRGHAKLASSKHHEAPAPASTELVSDIQPSEPEEPLAEASSSECGCASNDFVKQEPAAQHWKQPTPEPAPTPAPQQVEKHSSEEFFNEEEAPEPEEETSAPEEEIVVGGPSNGVSISSSSSGSSVTVNSSNSHVSVTSNESGSETVVTSTSETTTTE